MKKGFKECPFCMNEIKSGAIKCQFCGEMLPEEEKEIKKPENKECPFCKNEIKYDAVKCQYCGERLTNEKSKSHGKQNSKKGDSSSLDLKNGKLLNGKTFGEVFFSAKGRIGYNEWWFYYLLGGLILFAIVVLLALIIPNNADAISTILNFVWTIMTIFMTIKRAHDLGKSGRWILWLLVPFYNLYIAYKLLGGKSQPEINEYGDVPGELSKGIKTSIWCIFFGELLIGILLVWLMASLDAY